MKTLRIMIIMLFILNKKLFKNEQTIILIKILLYYFYFFIFLFTFYISNYNKD